jgi:hypothetical protein
MAPTTSFVATPKAVPDLKIPPSDSICTVRIIDSTAKGKGPASLILSPRIPGNETMEFPCFSFLVSNEAKGKNVLFDLGIRKDYENLAPVVSLIWVFLWCLSFVWRDTEWSVRC